MSRPAKNAARNSVVEIWQVPPARPSALAPARDGRRYRHVEQLDRRPALAGGRLDAHQRAPHVEALARRVVVDLARLEIEVRVDRRAVVLRLELEQPRDRLVAIEAHRDGAL